MDLQTKAQRNDRKHKLSRQPSEAANPTPGSLVENTITNTREFRVRVASFGAVRGRARRVRGVRLELNFALRKTLAAPAVVQAPARRRVAVGLEGAVMLSRPASALAHVGESAQLRGGDSDHETLRRRRNLLVQKVAGGLQLCFTWSVRLLVIFGIENLGNLVAGVLGFDDAGLRRGRTQV